MISAETNLGRLLDEHPSLVEVLAGRHAHFAKLRSRLLRRVMAPRVTVAQAAALAGLPVGDLVATLRAAVGEPMEAAPVATPAPAVAAPAPRPAVLDRLRAVEVDVRDDLRRGEEPFARIVAAVRGLAAGEALAIRAPFEPVPLYDVLGRRGLAHWTERLGPDDWRVWFHREGEAPAPAAATAVTPATAVAPGPAAAGDGALDVRGLEPPLPMVRVLERLDTLAPGATLTVLHERRPLFLYPQLDERGFLHETDEPEPGLVRIVIRRQP
jgi:uncharacterized protein (DUF2249 family)